MKNILVATDFSKEAYCALHYAARMFRHEKCKFFIANFYGNEIHTSVYSIVNEEDYGKKPILATKSKEASLEVLHRIKRDLNNSNHDFEIISSDQKLITGIPNIVAAERIDLVVMGTKGRHNTLENWLGSNTTDIIEKALFCPLLVVPREIDFRAPVNITFASELKKEFSEAQMGLLKEIIKEFKSEVTLLYIGNRDFLEPRQRDNLNLLKENLRGTKVKTEYLLSEHEISRAVSNYVKSHHTDLLCMVYYTHQFSHQLFREPVIQHIDHHLSFPFMVLPAD